MYSKDYCRTIADGRDQSDAEVARVIRWLLEALEETEASALDLKTQSQLTATKQRAKVERLTAALDCDRAILAARTESMNRVMAECDQLSAQLEARGEAVALNSVKAAMLDWMIENCVKEDENGWIFLRYDTSRQGKDHPDAKYWTAWDVAGEIGVDWEEALNATHPAPASPVVDRDDSDMNQIHAANVATHQTKTKGEPVFIQYGSSHKDNCES